MTIPTVNDALLPLLLHLNDGRDHPNQETFDALASQLGLTDAERHQLLPGGRTRIFTNRLAWAKVHLKAAQLIEAPDRGVWRITASGREFLAGAPGRVTRRSLKVLPAYSAWIASHDSAESPADDGPDVGVNGELSPEELIQVGYQRARNELASDILVRLRSVPPAFFEAVVVDILLAMGYGGSRRDAGMTLGRSGDGGIDGIIKEDRLGLDVIYLQAKRWEGTVGRPEIQKFVGALQGQRARKGVFITTSDFSSEAVQYAGHLDARIVLIDGKTLAQYMIDHDVGVTTISSFQLKRLDSDYFDDDAV